MGWIIAHDVERTVTFKESIDAIGETRANLAFLDAFGAGPYNDDQKITIIANHFFGDDVAYQRYLDSIRIDNKKAFEDTWE